MELLFFGRPLLLCTPVRVKDSLDQVSCIDPIDLLTKPTTRIQFSTNMPSHFLLFSHGRLRFLIQYLSQRCESLDCFRRIASIHDVVQQALSVSDR